jgi:tetratricopeptide (TPR) repeat protein
VADRSEAAGELLRTEGLLAQAREQFEIAVRYEPSRLPALIGLGNTSLHLGDLDRAEEVLTSAVERYPRSALALYQLGLLRQARGQLAEAERLYRRAIALQEVLGRPHALLGSILLVDGRVQEGWGHLQRAYDLGERSEGVMLARVRALVALGRRDDAILVAREAVDALPQSPEARDLLRRLLAAPAESGEREGG